MRRGAPPGARKTTPTQPARTDPRQAFSRLLAATKRQRLGPAGQITPICPGPGPRRRL